ncbi:MAG TPA: cell division ATP-binding protein FtsE [Candidatus Magasanikbacteria bacterium]|nr:cell division ATP-binding protein FtsE [Candidatus Magasanikbacteria bacterium]
MIKFKKASKVYPPDIKALTEIDFDVEPGEFISIVGQSGAGKSTLLRLMTRQDKPDHGDVVIENLSIKELTPEDMPYLRRKIGVVYQDIKLLPKKTVQENVSFALQVAGETQHRIHDVVPRVLDIVGLGYKADRYPGQLSGGEQQRVVIARSLVHRPKIVVADEPTGNLDAINTYEVIEILKKINEFGTTVVLVTHNREVVNSLKKRVITLHNGKIIADEQNGKYRL